MPASMWPKSARSKVKWKITMQTTARVRAVSRLVRRVWGVMAREWRGFRGAARLVAVHSGQFEKVLENQCVGFGRLPNLKDWGRAIDPVANLDRVPPIPSP